MAPPTAVNRNTEPTTQPGPPPQRLRALERAAQELVYRQGVQVQTVERPEGRLDRIVGAVGRDAQQHDPPPDVLGTHLPRQHVRRVEVRDVVRRGLVVQ